MLFPDCRNDITYNERFLTSADKECVRGFDIAVSVVEDSNALADDPILDQPLDKGTIEQLKDEYDSDLSVETLGDYVRIRLLEYLEMERNELITSMIDSTDDDIFNAIRDKVLKDNEKSDDPVEFYDTRCLYRKDNNNGNISQISD